MDRGKKEEKRHNYLLKPGCTIERREGERREEAEREKERKKQGARGETQSPSHGTSVERRKEEKENVRDEDESSN